MKNKYQFTIIAAFALFAVWVMNTAAYNPTVYTTHNDCKNHITDTMNAMRALLFDGAYSSLTGAPTNVSTFTNDAGYLTSASIPVTYYNSATTTSGVATFYLTDTKLSGGTALYTVLDFVDLAINSTAGLYTYSWSLAGDNKTLTVTARYSTNTGVLGLLGLALTNATVTVPNGTTVYIKVDGH